MVRHRKSGGFTLVELLVVIAIIALLIALLIGPMMRARRRALVLACPIATQAAGGSSVLVHPHGGPELALEPAGSHNHEIGGGPEWSTNGTWIGYTRANSYDPVIVYAMTGKAKVYPRSSGSHGHFAGWADDDHFICALDGGPGNNLLFIREAATGRVTQTYPCIFNIAVGLQVKRVPPSTGAYYIGALTTNFNGGVPWKVFLLRKDFSIKKVIDAGQNDDAVVSAQPSIDPLGEYAAWTTVKDKRTVVAWKSLRASSTEAPSYILPPDPTSVGMNFCDWTEDGNILAMVMDWGPASEKLVIMTRTGKVLRRIRQDKWPIYGYASYRKYMHQ